MTPDRRDVRLSEVGRAIHARHIETPLRKVSPDAKAVGEASLTRGMAAGRAGEVSEGASWLDSPGQATPRALTALAMP